MSKKESNKSPTIFALSTMTHLIPKYHYDKNGVAFNPNFNNRSYAKKAYKAYLKGQDYFMYKNDVYTVPRINKKALDDYLESMSIEDLENLTLSSELENIESNG